MTTQRWMSTEVRTEWVHKAIEKFNVFVTITFP